VDAIAAYCEASERADLPALLATLAPDAELVSPVSGRMVIRGERDLGVLLGAVYGALDGLRWHQEVGDGQTRVVMGEARILGASVTDAMVFELAPDGRIARIRPHLRPWLALTLFALRLLPVVVRRPGLAVRALRR
jgi:hypothetical protein